MKRIYDTEEEYKDMQLKVVNFEKRDCIISKKYTTKNTKEKGGFLMKKLTKKINTLKVVEAIVASTALILSVLVDFFSNTDYIGADHTNMICILIGGFILILLIHNKILRLNILLERNRVAN